MESRENGIADDDLYGQAVYAIDAEIGPNGRHGYLNLNPPFCSLKTQIGPKLLGDEIERLKKEVQESVALRNDLLDALIKNDVQAETIKDLKEKLEKAEEMNAPLRDEVKSLRAALDSVSWFAKYKLEDIEETSND